jgi:hypothetical protein
MGQVVADKSTGIDEVDCIVVVFVDAGGHRKNIGIKNDVFCGKPTVFTSTSVASDAQISRLRS